MSESKDKFTEKETQRRMDAALRGARITGHKPMKDISPKPAPPKRPNKKEK